MIVLYLIAAFLCGGLSGLQFAVLSMDMDLIMIWSALAAVLTIVDFAVIVFLGFHSGWSP